MTVQGILTSAKDVGNTVYQHGANAVRWGAHKVGGLGGFVKNTAMTIMTWIKGFIKNIPQYLSNASTHLKSFVQHIKDYKGQSAGIAGLTVVITLGLVALLSNKEPV